MIRHTYLRWLCMAALADWLITRTLTRAGIFIPKTPFFISVYQALTRFGQFASTLAALLAFGVIVWIAWKEGLSRQTRPLAILLVALVGLSLILLFVPPGGLLLLVSHLAFLGVAGWMGMRLIKKRPALALPVGAYLFGGAHHILPVAYEMQALPGPPPFSGELFNLGELLVVVSGLVFWWYWGRGAPRRAWVWVAIPAVLLSGMYLSVPAMTGILSIWSTGLTLFLPWPLYALSLLLTGVTLVNSFQRGDAQVGWAILLLAAGGYAPQLSSQIFFGLIGLWLLGKAGKDVLVVPIMQPSQLAAGSLPS